MKFYKYIFLLIIFCSCSKDIMKTTNIIDNNCKDSISFSKDILSIINNSCFSCHGDGSTLPKLSNYSEIYNNSTTILNAITGNGVERMPQLPNEPLPDTLIKKFSCWIEQGKLNN